MFLRCRGLEFQEGRDTDGRRIFPEDGTHHLPGRIIPATEGNPVGIRVREHHDPMTTQRAELLGLHFAESAGCQPDILRIQFAQDKGSLLGLDYRHRR